MRDTRFSDVCGTMDELRRLLAEERESVAGDPASFLGPLTEDAGFMLERMGARLAEYEAFAEHLRELSAIAQESESVDLRAAESALRALRQRAASREAFAAAPEKEMGELAETVRDAASAQEARLRKFKDVCIKLGALLDEVRGGRPWGPSEEELSSFRSEILAKYAAWLPPRPHLGRLLERLEQTTAHVMDPGKPGAEPLVQFEDGGVIRMSKIRYDEQVRNFHPAGAPPAPSGRQYRRKPVA